MNHGFLVIFEKDKDQKRMAKIHLVQLTPLEIPYKSKKQKVNQVDVLIFSKKSEKKISTVASGQNLLILLTDTKVKSTRLRAHFTSIVITFKQVESSLVSVSDKSSLVPVFETKNEWLGEVREQRQPQKKIKYVCMSLKPKQDCFVYLGYGADCVVFNPKFDSDFNSLLQETNLEEEKFAQRYEEQLLITVEKDKELIGAQIEENVVAIIGETVGIIEPEINQVA